MIFWMFSLVFLCQIAAHNGYPKLAERARAINDYFGNNSAAFMAAPVILLATLMYFVWGRKTLTWFNGLRIDDEPVEVLHFQFKRMLNNVPLMYLQCVGRQYVIYPATSQDGRKFPNIDMMKKDMALNEIQVGLLKAELEASGATEKRFWFFTKDVIFSFLLFVLITAIAFLAG
ncbi:hypothetical protein [Mucilaginibacter sp.]|uniref:hypothetical protein n=1 Tax=Mucilaginibacter sp. TaxID=1882438 RepID=UPI0035BC13F4